MDSNELDALRNIVNTYIQDEHKHWLESEKPANHIYHDLDTMLRYLEGDDYEEDTDES